MLSSLRFRLPALFVLGIVLAAVVASLIAIRSFQSNTRTHAATELRADSAGIVRLYEQRAGIGYVSVKSLQAALGVNEVFWVPAVPGAKLLAGPLPEISAQPPAAENGQPPARVVHHQAGRFHHGVCASIFRETAPASG